MVNIDILISHLLGYRQLSQKHCREEDNVDPRLARGVFCSGSLSLPLLRLSPWLSLHGFAAHSCFIPSSFGGSERERERERDFWVAQRKKRRGCFSSASESLVHFQSPPACRASRSSRRLSITHRAHGRPKGPDGCSVGFDASNCFAGGNAPPRRRGPRRYRLAVVCSENVIVNPALAEWAARGRCFLGATTSIEAFFSLPIHMHAFWRIAAIRPLPCMKEPILMKT